MRPDWRISFTVVVTGIVGLATLAGGWRVGLVAYVLPGAAIVMVAALDEGAVLSMREVLCLPVLWLPAIWSDRLLRWIQR